MKIVKYKKNKNGMYQVFFDNDNNVDLHEEIILKYQLLIKKEASNEMLEEMLEENKKYIAYDLAIKYIAKKMRTKKEIVEYLKKYNIDTNTIDEVNKLLSNNGYLDDSIYCSAFINDRILLSNDGPFKIKDKLIELGIKEDIIDKALVVFDYDLQKERITKLINKEFKTNKNKSNITLKNKIINKLYLLGYSKEIVLEVLDNTKFKSDKEAYDLQYKKVYNKLSKKYSDKELEYRVKEKMYQLGFRGDIE